MADFSDLMRKAAEAKAAMDALGKSGVDANNNMATSEQKLVDLRKQEIQTLKDESAAIRTTADSYKQYNQQALYGGRSDMQSHLSDMERELQYETLLNRQRWLGFTTPQQAYAWRQNEYNQRLLMNRAEWAGYATADQYIAYLQKEATAWQEVNAAMLQRVGLYKQNADAALQYYNALKGTHETIGQIGSNDNLSGVTQLNNALVGLPDQVTTQVSLLGVSEALSDLATYKAALASVPQTLSTATMEKSLQGTAGQPGTGTENVVGRYTGTIGGPKPVSERVNLNDTDAQTELAALTAELNQLPDVVNITANFNDAAAMAKAQAFYAFLDKNHVFTVNEKVVTSGSGAAGGGGGSPPVGGGVVEPSGDDEPNPNDIAAMAAAENNLAKALIEEHLAAQTATAANQGMSKSMVDAAVELAAERYAAEQATASTKDMALSFDQAKLSANASIAALNDLAAAAATVGERNQYVYAANMLQSAANKAVTASAMGTVAALAAEAVAAKDSTAAASQAGLAQSMLKNELSGLANPALAAKAALDEAASAAESSGTSAGHAYIGWGLLTKEVTLWAGLLGDTHMIGMVQLWHIALDGIIEVLALWVPALAAAAIGLTAWGAAGFQAAEKIAKQMYNVWTVSTALNTSVPPLVKNLGDLARIAQPQVYELFGDALTVLGTRGTAFATIVQETGDYLDKLGARITMLLTGGGNGLIDFFQVASKDLAIIGRGFDSLITILGALIKATALTHIAEDLATVGDAILSVVALIAKIPTPLLAAILALHGIILWGGLAVDVLAKVGIGFAGILAKIGPLNEVMTTFAATVGASTDKLNKMAQSAPAVQAVSQAMGMSSKEAAEFSVNARKLGVDIDQLALGTQAGRDLFEKYGAQLDATGQSAVKLAIATEGTEGAVAKVASGFTLVGGASKDAEAGLEDAGAAAADTEKASSGLLATLGRTATSLPLVGGLFTKLAEVPVLGWAGAAAVALGGLYIYLAKLPDPTQKWIDSLNQAVQKASIYQVLGVTVQTLAAATVALSKAQQDGVGNAGELAGAQQQLSGELSNELDHIGDITKAYGVSMPEALDIMNAAGVTTNQLFSGQASVWAEAQQQVKGLILGYEAMGQQLGAVGSDLNVLTVTESSQLKEMGNLNTAWDTWTGIVSGSETALEAVSKGMAQWSTDAKAAGATMTGVNAASMTLQGDFESQFSNIEKMFDAYRSQQALTGGSTQSFTSYVKAAVASLLPLAGHSAAAAAQVSALAQEAGGPATTNLSTLAKWVGNVKDPMQALKDATDKETEASSKLGTEAQTLSNQLQQILTPALAQAQFQAAGGQQVLNAFATALEKNGPAAQVTVTAAHAAAQELLAVTGNATTAKSTFVGWAESMHLSKSEADKLWDSATTGKNTLNETTGSVKKLQDQLGTAYGAQQKLAQPGEWDSILSSFKNGTFFETTFLSWIPAVQRGVQAMNHDIGNFFTQTIPHAFGVTENAFKGAWNGMVNWFTTSVPHALESAWNSVSGWFDQQFTHTIPSYWDKAWSDTVSPVTHAFDAVKTYISSNFDNWWKTHGEAVEQVWDTTWTTMKTVAEGIWDPIKNDAEGVFNWIAGPGVGILKDIWSGFEAGAKPVWDFIKDGFEGLWAIVEDTAKSTWTEIVGIATAAWDVVSTAAKVAWDLIVNFLLADFKSAGDAVVAIFKVAWDAVVALAKIAWDTIVAIINLVLDLLTGHWSTAWKDMQAYATQVWNVLKTLGEQTWNALMTFATQLWNNMWGAVKTTATQVWNALKSGGEAAFDAIWHALDTSFISPLTHFFTSTVPSWWDSFSTKAKSTFSTAWTDFNSDVVTPMEKWFSSTLPSAVEGAFKNSVNWVISNVINKVIGDINAVTKVVGIPAIPSVPGIAAGGLPMAQAAKLNGSVPGPSDSDNMLARVMGGEYVIRQPARMALEAKHGRGFMDYLNQYDTVSGSGSRGILASQRGAAGGGAMVRGYSGGGGILGSVLGSVEGFFSGVGSALSSDAKDLVGLVKGGASALTGLIAKGATAVFNGVWDGSIGTLLNLVPEGTLPGDVVHYIGAEIKNGIDGLLQAKDTAAQKTATAAEGTASAGSAMSNLVAIARYLMSHGASAIAAAGIAGDIFGESSGSPEAVGDGGFGLIGWTGNTEGLPAGYSGPTGNATKDLDIQMAGVLGYIDDNGGLGPINAATNVTQAGDIFSQRYERPLVLYSDTRPAIAQSVYNTIAGGAAIGSKTNAAPTGVSSVPGHASGGTVVAGVKDVTSDLNTRAAMLQGSFLETKWTTTAKDGNDYGPFLINLGAKTPSKTAIDNAETPSSAAKVALPYYQKAVAAIGPAAFKAGMESASTQAAKVAQHNTALAGTAPNFRGRVGADDAWAQVSGALGLQQTESSTGTASSTSGSGPSADSGTWAADAAAVVKDWAAFLPAWNTLNTEAQPKGVSDADWRNWRAYTYVGSESEKYLAPFVAMFSNPSSVTDDTVSSMTASEGNPLMTGILKGIAGGDSTQPLKKYWPAGTSPSPAVGTKYFSGALASALGKFNTYGTELGAAKHALDVLGGDVSSSNAGSGPTYIPGVIGAPPSTTATLTNLAGYATMGGPGSGVTGSGGTLGFAAGGPTIGLNQIASMFAVGLPMANGVSIPVQMPAATMGQLRKTQELPRTMGAAASGSANRVGLNVENLTVNNPVPEPPSQSITRSANRLAFLGGRGVA